MPTNLITDPATRTEADIARELLQGKRSTGWTVTDVTDLKTLQTIQQGVRGYREELGIPVLDPQETSRLVAVSSGTDPEKDDAMVAFLRKHSEIKTLNPETFGRLRTMSSALSAAEQASTPLGLNLLEVVVTFDGEHQRVSGHIADLLDQHPNTPLTPRITVGRARILLSEFVQTLQTQQQKEQGRDTRTKRHHKRVDKAVAQQDQGLKQQQSVRRLRQVARDGQPAVGAPALPAPRGRKGARKNTPAGTGNHA